MVLLVFACIIFILLYLRGTKNHTYWNERGVKHDRPLPFLGTDAKRLLLLRSVAQMAAETYWKYPKERFVGYYRGTVRELVIRDPELVKHIIVTDFAYFHSRGTIPRCGSDEPLMKNLFFAEGDVWKLLRQMMTPAFSSGKLKAMFPLITERAERLRAKTLQAAASGQPIDARDLMARYTTDFIGACGFGLDSDSLENEESEFRKLSSRIFAINFLRAVKITFKNLMPTLFMNVKYFGHVEDDMLLLINTVQARRGFKSSGRNDFIDFLMECQQRGFVTIESLEHQENGKPKPVELRIDDVLVAAQAFVFFAAGFETSSSATSSILHHLAFNPAVQKKAQKDVDRVLAKYDRKLSYDAIKEMTYLNWVLQEGLRISPPAGWLMRTCVKKYTLPGTDITIDPGVKVTVPILALHNDPQYFDEPEEFRPERFAPEEVVRRHKHVHLPFGDGPRSCIGGRLGVMQSLAGLAAILSGFNISPAPDSRKDLSWDPRSHIVQNIIGGVPLLFHPRDPMEMHYAD